MSDVEEIKMSSDEEESVKKERESVKNDDDDDFNDDNIMKILIATDIHLGYEQTTKRAQEDDSFRTFEEILQYATEYEVDMILLGGDLFHEAKPPHNVVMRCINLLRQYCLNDKQVKIQFLTKPELAFNHCAHKRVNYEDPNLNIGIPIFSIHGNHDDPSFGGTGSMDVLASTGFINYFGKWTDVTQVSIAPLIIQKGVTVVNFYGLSYMNDQRLSRLMRNEKFHLLRTKEIEDPFNILVLHQNRAQHGQNSYVPENFLPNFVNLVIWGHEHECRIMPEGSKVNSSTYICQPGSSVATSLAQGESVTKHVGILSIFKSKFKMQAVPLKTVRAFVFENVILSEHEDEITKLKSRSEAVEEFVDNYIENVLIPLAAKQQTGHPQQPEKPLIRLRVFYTDNKDVFDTLRLSQKYYHVAANPNDMILFRKCSLKLKKKDIKVESDDLEQIGEIFRFDDDERDWSRSVLGGMTDYFSQDNKTNKLTVLSVAGLNEALTRYVNANDTDAFKVLIKHQMKKTLDHLIPYDFKNKNEIIEAIKNYRDLRMQKQKEELQEVDNFFNNKDDLKAARGKAFGDSDDDNDDNDNEPVPVKGRGRGRGVGRGRGRGKAKESAVSPAKRYRGKATTLDITLDRGDQSITWKKPPQSRSRNTTKSIFTESDSD